MLYLLVLFSCKDPESNVSKGSCFISTICEVLQKHARESDLISMLKMAGRAMTEKGHTKPVTTSNLDFCEIFFNPSTAWEEFMGSSETV